MNEFQVPRILVVVMVPQDVEDWATHTEEALLLKYRARWVCLHGLPETENERTVSIVLPSDQPFTKASLTC